MKTCIDRLLKGGFGLLLFFPYLLIAQQYETDFETNPYKTPYERLIWENDGFDPNNWDNALAARTEIDTVFQVSGTKSLKVEFPKGQYGNSLANGTGTQVELLLPPKDEYFMSYFLRFSENFSWGTTSEGGKLPGLTNRDRCGSDFICDGTDGFSARFMWRKNGKGVLYLYHMDMPKQYGQDFVFKNSDGSDFLFEKGKWYHIAERVKVNTGPNNFDGIVTVWINGNEVLHLDNIRFQSNGDQVDNFFFSTFHGGSSAAWAPTDTCHIWFDDLRISASLNDVVYQSCSNPDANYFGENCLITSTREEKNFELKIYPNPTSGQVFLGKELNYQVMNATGIPLAEGTGSEINLFDYPSGIYFIKTEFGVVKVAKQ